MRKIPTLFVRDPDDRRYVTDEVSPGCEWVIAGEGVATRKYDGTCVRITPDGAVWTRREVKKDKLAPPAFVFEQYDEVTGKTVGWEPYEQSGFRKFIDEALPYGRRPGTYELCGPKINGNPEDFDAHVLVPHGCSHIPTLDPPVDAETIVDVVRDLARRGWEGVVWHHPDGRMVKLKGRDLRPEDER